MSPTIFIQGASRGFVALSAPALALSPQRISATQEASHDG
jgi:hypothetical protein